MSGSRFAIAAGAAALLAAPFAPSLAHADSDADAAALRADGGENGSGAISHTSAESDGESSSASANAIEQDGAPASEQTGGSSDSDGSSSGAAFDSAAQDGGDQAPGSVAVAPWSTDAQGGNAEADAALLRLTFAPDGAPEVTVELLRSHAEADGTSSFASSDGAAINVGGDQPLAVTFLHAEESSTDGGSAYVVAVNENQVGSSAEVDGQCAVEVPGVLQANCITVSEANDDLATSAASVDGGDQAAFEAQLISASSAAEAQSPIFTPAPSPSPSPAPAPDTSFSTPPASATASLPRTGGETTLLAGLGTLLLAAGLGMRRLGDDFQH